MLIDIVKVAPPITAALALLVSAGAFLVAARTARRSVRPVVIFEYEPRNVKGSKDGKDDSGGWHVRNIGASPAVDLLITVRGYQTNWERLVRFPALQAGERQPLRWVGHLSAWMLAVIYSILRENVSPRSANTTHTCCCEGVVRC